MTSSFWMNAYFIRFRKYVHSTGIKGTRIIWHPLSFGRLAAQTKKTTPFVFAQIYRNKYRKNLCTPSKKNIHICVRNASINYPACTDNYISLYRKRKQIIYRQHLGE